MKNSRARGNARRSPRASLPASGSSFAVTAVADEYPNEFAEMDKAAFGIQGNSQTGCKSEAQWTDQKHNLYLESIETSFVNQLYSSADVLSARGSFCSGCWQRFNFERSNPELHRNSMNDGHDFVTNPSNKHFSLATQHQSSASTSEGVDSIEDNSVSFALATSLKEHHLSRSLMYHEDIVSCNAEVSDQNFLDDIDDDAIEFEDEDRRGNTKRTRTCMTDVAHIDQIVPYRRSPSAIRATRLC